MKIFLKLIGWICVSILLATVWYEPWQHRSNVTLAPNNSTTTNVVATIPNGTTNAANTKNHVSDNTDTSTSKTMKQTTNKTTSKENKKSVNSPQNSTSLKSVIPFMDIWMATDEEIKNEINLNLMASNALPSDDYGTSEFFSDFQTVETEYQTLTQLNHYLSMDTTNLVNFVAAHHFDKDQNTVVDFKARAAMISEDNVLTTQQLQKMLAGDESLVQQFKNGSTNPSVPYWTFTQWNVIANDEVTNWNQLMVDYAAITTDQ